MPPNEFYNYIYHVDSILIKNFPICSIKDGVETKLMFDFSNVPCSIHVKISTK